MKQKQIFSLKTSFKSSFSHWVIQAAVITEMTTWCHMIDLAMPPPIKKHSWTLQGTLASYLKLKSTSVLFSEWFRVKSETRWPEESIVSIVCLISVWPVLSDLRTTDRAWATVRCCSECLWGFPLPCVLVLRTGARSPQQEDPAKHKVWQQRRQRHARAPHADPALLGNVQSTRTETFTNKHHFGSRRTERRASARWSQLTRVSLGVRVCRLCKTVREFLTFSLLPGRVTG